MSDVNHAASGAAHTHDFLGSAHEQNERRTWAVIALCTAMMIAEIVGGSLFGLSHVTVEVNPPEATI